VTGETVGTTQTDQSGFFIVKGLSTSTAYSLSFTKTGYVTQNASITTGSGSVITDLATPVFMPTMKTAAAPFEEFVINLQWNSVEPYSATCGISGMAADCTDPAAGNKGAELDLYVQRPDGQIISYNNFGNQYGQYMRDSYDDMMPGEGVYIKNLQTSPSGVYKIAVSRLLWGTIANVGAKVVLTRGGTAPTKMWIPPATCIQNWWVVATIDPATGNYSSINTCQDYYPF
jgi:hypothetical protein